MKQIAIKVLVVTLALSGASAFAQTGGGAGGSGTAGGASSGAITNGNSSVGSPIGGPGTTPSTTTGLGNGNNPGIGNQSDPSTRLTPGLNQNGRAMAPDQHQATTPRPAERLAICVPDRAAGRPLHGDDPQCADLGCRGLNGQ